MTRTLSSLLSLVLTSTAFGQTEEAKKGSWQNVLGLSPGAKVRVLRMDSTETSGRVETISTAGIGISSKSGVVSVRRSDVRLVTVPRPVSRRGRHVALAAMIGAGAGAGILGTAVAIDNRALSNDGRLLAGHALLGALGGALIGAAIGAPLGLVVSGHETIYERRR
jgi:hypothetical protein